MMNTLSGHEWHPWQCCSEVGLQTPSTRNLLLRKLCLLGDAHGIQFQQNMSSRQSTRVDNVCEIQFDLPKVPTRAQRSRAALSSASCCSSPQLRTGCRSLSALWKAFTSSLHAVPHPVRSPLLTPLALGSVRCLCKASPHAKIIPAQLRNGDL